MARPGRLTRGGARSGGRRRHRGRRVPRRGRRALPVARVRRRLPAAGLTTGDANGPSRRAAPLGLRPMRPMRIVIVGGGPAGYEAALVAAEHGADVTVVTREGLGGNSVLWDCVPSKTLIVSAEAMGWMQSAHRLGVRLESGADIATRATVDMGAVMDRVKRLAGNQSADIGKKVESTGARVVTGSARLAGATAVEVEEPDGSTQVLPADVVLIGAGSNPRVLPFSQPDGVRVFTSRELFSLREVNTRTPSGWENGSTRGLDPAPISTTSAGSTCVLPSGSSTSTAVAPARRALPVTTRAPVDSTFLPMSADWLPASRFTRSMTAPMSTVARVAMSAPDSSRTPSRCADCIHPIASADTIRVLEGTQSHSTLLPPRPSRVTTVTSAPCSAATSAAS